MTKSPKSKLAVGVLIVSGLVAVYWLTPLRSTLSIENIVRLVERIRENPWAPLIFVGTYVLSCVLAPLTIFPVVGGVLFGFWKGFLFNTIAANVGSWITFFIARKFGREAVAKLMRGRFKTFDESVAKQGLWAIFSLRMIGFPPYLVANYAAGLSGVRVRDYVLATFLGMLIWTLILTYFANTFWEAIVVSGTEGFQKAFGRYFWPVLGGFLAAAAVVALTVFLKKRTGAKKLVKKSGSH